MMKKAIFMGTVMIVVLFGGWAQAEDCEIKNGSFEEGDPLPPIDPITEDDEPNGWDVNLPEGFFSGRVDINEYWDITGNYCLSIYAINAEFNDVNNIGTVSQEVCFTGVDAIWFDLMMERYFYYWLDWDPNTCTAVLLIDDTVVWESNDVGPDVAGEYYNQIYEVNETYKDGGMHKLSVGLRVNVTGKLGDFYFTHWDFVRFGDLPCGGHGYLPEDFSKDCYVDMKDLKMLVDEEVWLQPAEPNNIIYNLFDDDVIDFRDFAIFANVWLGTSYVE